MTGILVVLEGKDFSGKTGQREALAKVLREAGHEVLFTREPGGTPYAERIREMLFEFKNQVSPCTEILALQAARMDHLEKVILPACAEGKIVLCDRFYYSTYAYQVHEEVQKNNGQPLALFGATLEHIIKDLPPTIQLYLDVPEEELKKRQAICGQRNAYDDVRPEHMSAIGEAYDQLAAQGELTVVDGTGTPEEVTTRLRLIIESMMVEVKQQLEAEAAAKEAAAQDTGVQQEAPKAQTFPPMDEFIEARITSSYEQSGFIEQLGEEEAEEWRKIIRNRCAMLNAKLDEDENMRDGQRYPTVAQGIAWCVQVRMSALVSQQLKDQFVESLAAQAPKVEEPAES